MEFRSPKVKKHVAFESISRSLNEINVSLDRYSTTGVFNGFQVIIEDAHSMKNIYNLGNFGKGNLSKSEPRYNVKKDDIPRILWNEQFRIESNWQSEVNYSHDDRSDITLSNISVSQFFESTLTSPECSSESWKSQNKKKVCCSETSMKDDFIWKISDDSIYGADKKFCHLVNQIIDSGQLKQMVTQKEEKEKVIVISFNQFNLSARLEARPFGFKECLNLNLAESFYLQFELQHLKIVDIRNVELTLSEIWLKFCSAEKNFLEKYIVYHYYRKKGWIVMSGLKYGGDYLLYKDGPAYNHASYVVKILHGGKTPSWNEFLAINRLVETFNKDILFCAVVKNLSFTKNIKRLDSLINYQVLEVMSRRGLKKI